MALVGYDARRVIDANRCFDVATPDETIWEPLDWSAVVVCAAAALFAWRRGGRSGWTQAIVHGGAALVITGFVLWRRAHHPASMRW